MVGSHPFAEKQSVYSTAPADWAIFVLERILDSIWLYIKEKFGINKYEKKVNMNVQWTLFLNFKAQNHPRQVDIPLKSINKSYVIIIENTESLHWKCLVGFVWRTMTTSGIAFGSGDWLRFNSKGEQIFSNFLQLFINKFEFHESLMAWNQFKILVILWFGFYLLKQRSVLLYDFLKAFKIQWQFNQVLICIIQ